MKASNRNAMQSVMIITAAVAAGWGNEAQRSGGLLFLTIVCVLFLLVSVLTLDRGFRASIGRQFIERETIWSSRIGDAVVIPVLVAAGLAWFAAAVGLAAVMIEFSLVEARKESKGETR